MARFTAGTCIRCLNAGCTIDMDTQVCTTCSGTPNVSISGGGNTVTVSGSNLTVFSAGGKVTAAVSSPAPVTDAQKFRSNVEAHGFGRAMHLAMLGNRLMIVDNYPNSKVQVVIRFRDNTTFEFIFNTGYWITPE